MFRFDVRAKSAYLEKLWVHQRQLDDLPQLSNLIVQPPDTSKRSRTWILQGHVVDLGSTQKHQSGVYLVGPDFTRLLTMGSTSRGRIRMMVNVVMSSDTRTPALS